MVFLVWNYLLSLLLWTPWNVYSAFSDNTIFAKVSALSLLICKMRQHQCLTVRAPISHGIINWLLQFLKFFAFVIDSTDMTNKEKRCFASDLPASFTYALPEQVNTNSTKIQQILIWYTLLEIRVFPEMLRFYPDPFASANGRKSSSVIVKTSSPSNNSNVYPWFKWYFSIYMYLESPKSINFTCVLLIV